MRRDGEISFPQRFPPQVGDDRDRTVDRPDYAGVSIGAPFVGERGDAPRDVAGADRLLNPVKPEQPLPFGGIAGIDPADHVVAERQGPAEQFVGPDIAGEVMVPHEGFVVGDALHQREEVPGVSRPAVEEIPLPGHEVAESAGEAAHHEFRIDQAPPPLLGAERDLFRVGPGLREKAFDHGIRGGRGGIEVVTADRPPVHGGDAAADADLVLEQDVRRDGFGEFADQFLVGCADRRMPDRDRPAVVVRVLFVDGLSIEFPLQRGFSGRQERGTARMVAPPGVVGVGHEEHAAAPDLIDQTAEFPECAEMPVGGQVVRILLVESAFQVGGGVYNRRNRKQRKHFPYAGGEREPPGFRMPQHRVPGFFNQFGRAFLLKLPRDAVVLGETAQ